MNDAIVFSKGAFSALPFLSPALETNKFGEYQYRIDELNGFIRGAIFAASSVALSIFAISHMTGINSTLTFTLTLGFATPVAIVVGCVALGILGYKLDQMLTLRAATDLAVQEYLNKSNISWEALDWLIADTGRIKQLLTHENIDLSKTDYSGNGLLRGAARLGNLEMFTLLCENSCDQDKAKVFFRCVDNLQDNYWGEESLKIVDYMVDTKQISAVMFTDEEQCSMQKEPLRGHLKWTDEHIIWLQKLGSLGFSVDVGGVKSIRYAMSEDIFSKALDHAAHRPTAVQNDIFGAMRFLQKNSKNEASAILEGNVWHKDMLEAIAPCLVATRSALSQAFQDDNVTIGRLLWDMSGSENTRKFSFIERFAENDNTKFVTYLLEKGKVSANMFTEKEQSDVLKDICFYNGDRVFEILNKLVEFGFDIRAINSKGKTVREILIDQIAFSLIIDKKAAAHLTQSLESVDKILEKQNIATGVVLKKGQKWNDLNDSYLQMLPDDILNYIVYNMVITH